MKAIYLIPLFFISWTVLIYLSLLFDNCKIKLVKTSRRAYGFLQAIEMPISKNTITNTIHIGFYRLEISKTYCDVKKTKIYNSIINQEECQQ